MALEHCDLTVTIKVIKRDAKSIFGNIPLKLRLRSNK